MTYEVVTFKSETHGALARIRMPMPTKAEKGGSPSKVDWSPVVVHAPTEEEAAERAHAFYASELERLDRKAANMAAGREKAAATRKDRKDVA